MNKPPHRFFKKGGSAGARSQLPRRRHGSHPPVQENQTPKGEPVLVEGFLQLKGKFGFVLSEDSKVGDVLIQGPSLRLAMNGDRVRARVTSGLETPPADRPPKPSGSSRPPAAVAAARRSGEIVEVLTHARQTVVGAFRRMGNLPVLVPEDDSAMVHLVDLQSFVPHVGDIVTALIRTWPTPKDAATGVLTEVLGPRDAPGVDLQSLIRKYELPDAFPPQVTAEAEAWGADVPEVAYRDRETFFDQRVFTIDGADAKDFDDAVSLEHHPFGWRLGVHIADVAHYVAEGSALDQEAYRRATSVYLSGTVLPMLPFPLSDNLCSLRPDRVRLTLSCVMDIDREGNVTAARVAESAIRSAKRFTYEDVESILKGEGSADVAPAIAADVLEMGGLAKLLRAKRFERGSLDFDFPEPEVITGLDGRPIDIRRRGRLESHRLIEDFMLLANESVARYMKDRPFLYRVHETPDAAKMEKLQKALELLGLQIPRHIDRTHPSALQRVIKASEGTPVQAMVHIMVLRSMKQAVYSPVNKGHYGLASACYTHFTSPIRRYPDLVVHRALRDVLRHRDRSEHWKKELPVIAVHTSRRERVAVDAEREFLDIQKVRLMESRVGKTFTGVISSVTNFGIFIQLNEFFVEGLVHVTTLGNDFYVFDEARMTLRGRRSGQAFSMGQKVEVQLAAANVLKHQLDFKLLSTENAPRTNSERPSRPHRGRRGRPK